MMFVVNIGSHRDWGFRVSEMAFAAPSAINHATGFTLVTLLEESFTFPFQNNLTSPIPGGACGDIREI